MHSFIPAGLLGAGLLIAAGASSPSASSPSVMSMAGSEDAGGDCCSAASAEAASLRTNYMALPPVAQDQVRGAAKGRVVFVGEIPERDELTITEAQARGCTDEGAKVAADVRSLLIGKDRGIANAVVSVWVPEEELVVPEEPVVLDQVQCRFSAPITLVPAGTTIEYKNSDKVPHNVHVYSLKNKPFNKTLPAGASQLQKLDQAEMLQVKCDIHPWMKAYVFVSGTNHAVLTDEHGAFELPGLPPGTHTLRVWQEKLGKSELQVTIDAEGRAEPVLVEMKAKAKKTRRRR